MASGSEGRRMGKVYKIRLDARLSERDREAFCDMDVVDVPPATVLYGDVLDESHLHGIIAQLRAMGITVVSVHPVEP